MPFKKGNIPWNKRSYDIKNIVKLYTEDKLSCNAISKIVGCEDYIIGRLLHQQGIQTPRSIKRSESTKKKIALIKKQAFLEGKLGHLQLLSKKRAEFVKGKTWEELYGLEKADEMRRAHSERMKRENPSFLPMSNEGKEKRREATKKNWQKPEFRNRVLSAENLKKRKEQCNKPEFKEKSRQKALAQWRNEESRNKILASISHKPTKPEKVLSEILINENLSFNYVGDGKRWFHGFNTVFNPDFISYEKKIIIEVYGDYWHNLKKNKSKDGLRVMTYEKYGYRTIILWEHELIGKNKLPISEVIKKINISNAI